MPLLHFGHSFGWGAWHIEPTIIGGALIVIGLYVYGIDRLRQADRGYAVPWRRVGAFAAGSLVIFLSLAWTSGKGEPVRLSDRRSIIAKGHRDA